MTNLLFPGLDEATLQKLTTIANHYDIEMFRLVQSTCATTFEGPADDGETYWKPIPEYIEWFGNEHPFTPTRRRLILYYATQIKYPDNPFTINELMDTLPSSGYNSWYTRKTIGHALGFARVEEEEWFDVKRETFGTEERWFVGLRPTPYAPLDLPQLERLYPLTGQDVQALGYAFKERLVNIAYSTPRVMLDCMTQKKTLDREELHKHIVYYNLGYDRPARTQAILIDFIGDNFAEYTYTEVIRKKMVEMGRGHPAVWMTQESLGHFLRRAWQTQESRHGRLSDTYRLERLRGSNTWLWRAIPHGSTTDQPTRPR